MVKNGMSEDDILFFCFLRDEFFLHYKDIWFIVGTNLYIHAEVLRQAFAERFHISIHTVIGLF